MKETVKIVEVGPRDGLQNEKEAISVDTKVELIERLIRAGVTNIEAGAFVSPKWVPQMAGSAEVLARIPRKAGVRYAALTPNMKGLEAALQANCDEVAVFGAATETFSLRNINCSIAESLDRFSPVVAAAKNAGVHVRGYVSCALSCPYEGDVSPAKAAELVSRLYSMGCDEISLGDTVGRGNPLATERLLVECMRNVPVEKLAGHFHDTYGLALANIAVSINSGVRIFDSSVAGLGGCPYAKGASGNVATEDVVYLLHALGYQTGIDIENLVAAGDFINKALSRETSSRVGRATQAAQLCSHSQLT